MKAITLTICALFVLSFAIVGCDTTEDANEKIEQCLADEYGDDEAQDLIGDWELTCEDEDEGCDECIDCIMDEECDAILNGDCSENCE